MTSQVLSSSSASASGASSAVESLSSDALQSNGASSNNMKTAVLEPAIKLPYQADHQVELLNLQAETECLLQQLTMLKQQRHVVVSGVAVDDESAHN